MYDYKDKLSWYFIEAACPPNCFAYNSSSDSGSYYTLQRSYNLSGKEAKKLKEKSQTISAFTYRKGQCGGWDRKLMKDVKDTKMAMSVKDMKPAKDMRDKPQV